MKERRRLTEAQRVRHLDQPIHRSHRHLGVTPLAAWPAGAGDNPAPDPAGIDARPDGDHPSCYPTARHVRRLHREVPASGAGPDLRVEKEDIRGRYGDHGLPRPATGSGASPGVSTPGPPKWVTWMTRIYATGFR